MDFMALEQCRKSFSEPSLAQDALLWNLRDGGWPFSLVVKVPEEPGGLRFPAYFQSQAACFPRTSASGTTLRRRRTIRSSLSLAKSTLRSTRSTSKLSSVHLLHGDLKDIWELRVVYFLNPSDFEEAEEDFMDFDLFDVELESEDLESETQDVPLGGTRLMA